MNKPVVYVDDEAMICRVVRIILERANIPVVVFSDPHEAVTYINGNSVLLVICDYRMPEMTGLELLEQLQVPVPFYIISGDIGTAPWTVNDPRIAGVLTKPFAADRLLALVRSYL